MAEDGGAENIARKAARRRNSQIDDLRDGHKGLNLAFFI